MAHEEYIRIIPGAKNAVLFIHGILGTPNHFQMLLPFVPGDWSICNLLLPGHGGTVRDFSASSMKQWRAYVHGKLSWLLENHESVYIVGHSMGTLLAMEQAIRNPDRIRGLFLLAVPLRVGLRFRMVKNAWAVYRGRIPEGDALLEATRDACSITQDRNLLRYLGWIPRYLELFSLMGEVRRSVQKLRVPGIVFQSRMDEMASMKSVQDMERSDALEIHILENSMHFYYSPEDLNSLLESFRQFLGEQPYAS